MRAQVGVGREQELVEVLPGVVAAGLAALDLDDQRQRSHRVGDGDDLADLLDGAGLEHDVLDADLAQLVDEGDGVVEVGDAGSDDDRVDGRAGRAGLLHQTLAAEVQLPQVRVEEQRVERVGATGVEQRVELGDVLGEDRLADLAAAGELGPEAGVRGCGDDRGIDGGRRHAGEQDRRASGEPAEAGLGVQRAVGQRDDGRGVGGPRRRESWGRAGGGERTVAVARRGRHDADATDAELTGRQLGGDVGRAEVDHPAGAGVHGGLQRVDPVDRVDDGAHASGSGPARRRGHRPRPTRRPGRRPRRDRGGGRRDPDAIGSSTGAKAAPPVV